MTDYESLFSYCRDTGSLFWKIKKPQVYPGMRAGNKNKEGYVAVRINGKDHRAHRIIWVMHNGPIPTGLEIDHIDGNPSNNRIENLRAVTHLENGKNQKLRVNNKSGATGVYFNKKTKKWIACMRINGKAKYYGCYVNFPDACAARIVAEVNERFHPNHGAMRG